MCGIIGIFDQENAANPATLGLFAEQHRGQESCGMAVTDGKVIKIRKKMGLVKDVFTPDKIAELNGKIAIGHVRYPTRGISNVYNSQPFVVETLSGPSYALTSNGDVVNYQEVRENLEKEGVYFSSGNDGELILKFIVFQIEKNNRTVIDAIKLMMKGVRGAYSTVLTTKSELLFFRDPYAIRPMSYGKTKAGSIVVASESCALDILYMDWIREVKPAEIIEVNRKGIQTYENNPNDFRKIKENKHCIFEHIYFSRPDSVIFDENVFQVRKKIGEMLADADDIKSDIVVPVPDSSNFIALGYAERKQIPFELGLIRNHYVGRTFIKPEQTVRDESVYQKFNPLPNFFQDKVVTLIDDSIVRGTTLKKIVKLIRNAGAREIHLNIGSPPVRFSCFYGIDTPTKAELIANQKTIEQIREFVAADSLQYLSLKNLKNSVQNEHDFCYACFNGEYPIK